jgi:hypothetical protein
MNDDPVIDRIREARHRISASFDHDPKKLVHYYIRLQQLRADENARDEGEREAENKRGDE